MPSEPVLPAEPTFTPCHDLCYVMFYYIKIIFHDHCRRVQKPPSNLIGSVVIGFAALTRDTQPVESIDWNITVKRSVREGSVCCQTQSGGAAGSWNPFIDPGWLLTASFDKVRSLEGHHWRTGLQKSFSFTPRPPYRREYNRLSLLFSRVLL